MQKQDAFVVTIIKPPVKEMTVADLIIGSLGATGALLLLALALGVVVGALLVIWNRIRPRDWRPMPPVAPSFLSANGPRSSQSR